MEATGSNWSDSDWGQVAGSPSDNTTLLAVLRDYREVGFTADFRAVGSGGEVRCSSCEVLSPARSLTVKAQRRLEGASDPGDMMLVVAASCPRCSARGVMTLSYGPAVSEWDSAVLSQLPCLLPHAATPPT